MVVAEALLVQLEQSLTKAKENEVTKYLDQISEVGRQSDNRYQDKTTSLIWTDRKRGDKMVQLAWRLFSITLPALRLWYGVGTLCETAIETKS